MASLGDLLEMESHEHDMSSASGSYVVTKLVSLGASSGPSLRLSQPDPQWGIYEHRRASMQAVVESHPQQRHGLTESQANGPCTCRDSLLHPILLTAMAVFDSFDGVANQLPSGFYGPWPNARLTQLHASQRQGSERIKGNGASLSGGVH